MHKDLSKRNQADTESEENVSSHDYTETFYFLLK